MPYLTWDPSQSLYYETVGRGAPVVLMHSALTDLRQWDPQIEALSAVAQVVRYDARGYGKSSDAETAFDPADDLIRLLDALDIESAALVGSSMGGSVALHAALTYPHRVNRVVLIGSGMFGFEASVQSPNAEQLERKYEQLLKADDHDALIGFFEELWLSAGNAVVPSTARSLFWTMNRDRLNAHGVNGPEFKTIDDVQSLSALQCPITALIGDHDTLFCQQVVGHLQKVASPITVERIANAAHFPNMTQPTVVNHILQKILA